MTYLVIAYVDGKSYLTRVTADSALRAEHVSSTQASVASTATTP